MSRGEPQGRLGFVETGLIAALAVQLLLWAWTGWSCVPPGPYGDHATFLLDALDPERGLLARHADHRLVGTRLLAELEVATSAGAPWLAPVVGVLALLGSLLTFGSGWRRDQRALAGIVLVGLVLSRVPTAAMLALATNVQYPLALALGLGSASLLLREDWSARGLLGLLLGLAAGLCSTEGLLALPLCAGLLASSGRWHEASAAGVVGAVGILGWFLGWQPAVPLFGAAAEAPVLAMVQRTGRLLGTPWTEGEPGLRLWLASAAGLVAVGLLLGSRGSRETTRARFLGLYGLGTVVAVAIGRSGETFDDGGWRLLLAPSALFAGAVLVGIARWPRRGPLLVGLVMLCVLGEGLLRAPAHVASCLAVEAPIRAWWSGDTDASELVMPVHRERARFIRVHVHEAGLYLPEGEGSP